MISVTFFDLVLHALFTLNSVINLLFPPTCPGTTEMINSAKNCKNYNANLCFTLDTVYMHSDLTDCIAMSVVVLRFTSMT